MNARIQGCAYVAGAAAVVSSSYHTIALSTAFTPKTFQTQVVTTSGIEPERILAMPLCGETSWKEEPTVVAMLGCLTAVTVVLLRNPSEARSTIWRPQQLQAFVPLHPDIDAPVVRALRLSNGTASERVFFRGSLDDDGVFTPAVVVKAFDRLNRPFEMPQLETVQWLLGQDYLIDARVLQVGRVEYLLYRFRAAGDVTGKGFGCLCRDLIKLHSHNWVHGDIRTRNIVFR